MVLLSPQIILSFGLINISETDYSRLNQEARTNFDTLISDIKNCKNSIDDNCLCYTSLSSFYETHEIEINNQEIKLLDVKEGNEITMAKETIEETVIDKSNGNGPTGKIDSFGGMTKDELMNALRIMTIHAAKGLQFPMVIVRSSLSNSAVPMSRIWAVAKEKHWRNSRLPSS